MIFVYTALFGPSKDFLMPPVHTDGVRYIAFTDRSKVEANGWERRPAQCDVSQFSDGRRIARYHKCLSHLVFEERPEITIWCDATHRPTGDMMALAMTTLGSLERPKNPFLTYKHAQRTCVYQEIRACLQLKKDLPHLLHKQEAAYREAGHPAFAGLWETSVIVREHVPIVATVNEAWWRQLRAYSNRDQVSLPFVCRREGLTPRALPGKAHDNPPGFQFKSHW